MKLTLGFSPCPNDTFIFDALVNGKIDAEGFEFEPVLEDVETLNQWALQGRLDITKLSFPAYFKTVETYCLLPSGSALGNGVGPLLVSGSDKVVSEEDVNAATVLLPGENTTANLLFSFAYPNAKNKRFQVFHEIEDMLVTKEAELGVIIHENRFTYESKGLFKVKDLGEYWEQKLNAPIPLGGIVIKKILGEDVYAKVNRLINKSLQVAFDSYPEISEYVKCHAQAMLPRVMRQHIDLYVNNFSLNLGEKGFSAVETLHEVYKDQSGATKLT